MLVPQDFRLIRHEITFTSWLKPTSHSLMDLLAFCLFTFLTVELVSLMRYTSHLCCSIWSFPVAYKLPPPSSNHILRYHWNIGPCSDHPVNRQYKFLLPFLNCSILGWSSSFVYLGAHIILNQRENKAREFTEPGIWLQESLFSNALHANACFHDILFLDTRSWNRKLGGFTYELGSTVLIEGRMLMKHFGCTCWRLLRFIWRMEMQDRLPITSYYLQLPQQTMFQ